MHDEQKGAGPVDATGNDYIGVIPPSEHRGTLTWPMLQETTLGFRRPVLFKKLVPLPEEVEGANFYRSLGTEDPTVWRRQIPNVGVDMANRYDYVTGAEGSAEQFLEEVFEGTTSTYAFLGPLAYGLNPEDGTQTWGSRVFRALKERIFAHPWLGIERWRMTGQAFFGSSSKAYGEVSEGFPGSDWHSAASANLFVMVSGRKRWMTFPPRPGEQLGNTATRIEGGLRVQPKGVTDFDTVHLERGDVLFNPPFEWHKVLNDKGFSCGLAFRLKDIAYAYALTESHAKGLILESNPQEGEAEGFRDGLRGLMIRDDLEGEDGAAHLLTSAMYASLDPRRAALLLGLVESTIAGMICHSFTHRQPGAPPHVR